MTRRKRLLTDIANSDQPAHFTCPNGRTFFSSSIVWGECSLWLMVGFVTNNHLVGVIGPNRMFGPGAIYTNVQWFWLIGALLPVVFYVIIRVFPRSKLRFLNAPV